MNYVRFEALRRDDAGRFDDQDLGFEVTIAVDHILSVEEIPDALPEGTSPQGEPVVRIVLRDGVIYRIPDTLDCVAERIASAVAED